MIFFSFFFHKLFFLKNFRLRNVRNIVYIEIKRAGPLVRCGERIFYEVHANSEYISASVTALSNGLINAVWLWRIISETIHNYNIGIPNWFYEKWSWSKKWNKKFVWVKDHTSNDWRKILTANENEIFDRQSDRNIENELRILAPTSSSLNNDR